ncbi:MAG: S53 family peptidase, partial [Gemmatimonadaceae bacterium]
ATGQANRQATITVTLKLRRRAELPDLDAPPASNMTREELATRYGASKEDIDMVSRVFNAFGLETVSTNPATRTVVLSGTIGDMEEAFQVKLFNYTHPTGNYRGRVGYLQLPTEVKDIVQGVFGLDDRRVVKRRRHPTRDANAARALSSIPSSWYTPKQLATHYKFPTGHGKGQVVGLLEFGGGFFQSDLDAFCKLAGTAVPTVKAVSVDGASTSRRDGAEGEVMLDVEIIAGACPEATIVVYFAHWSEQGWVSIVDAVVHDAANDPGVVSISWGYPEDTGIWSRSAIKQVNESLKEAAHLGITVCVASGDDGSSDADMDGHAHVDFPTSSQYVLSVGGTTIPKKNGSGPDLVWFEGNGLRTSQHGSTGGGVSAVFARPTWQSKIALKSVNPQGIVGRCVPDVAANADWDASPYLLVVDQQAEGNGGTSAAAPLVASLVTLINAERGAGKRIGYLTPLLYHPPTGAGGTATVGSIGCTDIEVGNNTTAHGGGYTASLGYDAVSGWGTPYGTKLAAALQAPVPAHETIAAGASGARSA